MSGGDGRTGWGSLCELGWDVQAQKLQKRRGPVSMGAPLTEHSSPSDDGAGLRGRGQLGEGVRLLRVGLGERALQTSVSRCSGERRRGGAGRESGAFQAELVVKNLPADVGDKRRRTDLWFGRSPGRGVATHARTLTWEIPWTEEPGGLQCKRS